MQSRLVRISNWLTFSLLGLAGGWLIFGKAFAPGGWPLRLSKNPGDLPPKERWLIPAAKDGAEAHDSSPLLTVATRTTAKPKTSAQITAAKRLRLPAEALDAAGLTEADRPRAEAIIDEAWKQMERGLTERARPIADPKAEEKGARSYFIPADQAAGDAVLVQMRKQLQQTFGKEPTAAMLAGMHFEEYFAAFGRMDVKIQVVPQPSGTDFISLFYSNPADGKAIELTMVDPEEFERRFGKVIPLPEGAGSR